VPIWSVLVLTGFLAVAGSTAFSGPCRSLVSAYSPPRPSSSAPISPSAGDVAEHALNQPWVKPKTAGRLELLISTHPTVPQRLAALRALSVRS